LSFSLAFSLPTFYHNQRPASTFPYLVIACGWPCERIMKKHKETKYEKQERRIQELTVFSNLVFIWILLGFS
jgi:hypothetical protein